MTNAISEVFKKENSSLNLSRVFKLLYKGFRYNIRN